MSEATDSSSFPKGVNYLFVFFFFNFLSCMIVMDAPIFLYAESLGASATVMGLIAGLTPIMVVFQIPAADHVGRVGYKRFITTGWTLRLLFILPLVAVPLLSNRINAQSQLAIVIGALFCFNLVRGIASTGWFPWITGIIPEKARGRYLTTENAVDNAGSLISLLITALILGTNPTGQKFALLFTFSLCMGLVSLWFVHRVPDSPVNEVDVAKKQPVLWIEIVNYTPFRKLLWVTFMWAVLMGGLMAFVVKFLKGPGKMPDNLVLYSSIFKFVGGVATLWFMHSRLDRVGSRPLMLLALGLWGCILTAWVSMSGEVIKIHFEVICALSLVMGFAFCMFNMSMTKLAMATVPQNGKSHFFALYSVVGSLAVGTFPILWGILIDALDKVNDTWLGITWNQYSVYFTALMVVLMVVLVLVTRLEEEKAVRVNQLLRDLIRNNPLRDWLRR